MPKTIDHKIRPRHLALIQAQSAPSHFTWSGLRFLTDGNGIYPPSEQSSSIFVIKNLPPMKNQSIAEIGTGSGILAIILSKQHNNVIASDIDAEAIRTAINNATRNQAKVDFRQSDLFDNYTTEDKFDKIVFNAPFLNKPIEHTSELALCDVNAVLASRFLHQAVKFLQPNGKIFMTSSNLADLQTIRRVLINLGLRARTIGNETDPSSGFVRLLLEISRRPSTDLPRF